MFRLVCLLARAGVRRVAFRHVRCLGVLLAASSLWVAAQSHLEQGLAAYKSGNYANALQEFRTAAEAGESTAMFSLGFMYLNGEGVKPDPKEAAQWLGLAAERGIAPAQHSLALLYYEGKGVEKNTTVAANYFESAALQGLGDAQYNLGVLYSHGDGVRQDWSLSQFWHRKAAEQGVTDAQVALGVMAANGQGVPQDYQEAARWFGLAASKGNAKARQTLETAFGTNPVAEESSVNAPALPPPTISVGDVTPPSTSASETVKPALSAASPSTGVSSSAAAMRKPAGAQPDLEEKFWEQPPPRLSESSFRDLQGRAVSGDPIALVSLSWQYLHGVSTQASLVRSYVWAKIAERRGSIYGARLAEAVSQRMSPIQKAAAKELLERRN